MGVGRRLEAERVSDNSLGGTDEVDSAWVELSFPIGGPKPVTVVNQSPVILHDKPTERPSDLPRGGITLPGGVEIPKDSDPNLVAAVALVILALAVLVGVRMWFKRRAVRSGEDDPE